MKLIETLKSKKETATDWFINNKKQVLVGAGAALAVALLAFSSFFITNMIVKVNSNTHDVKKDSNLVTEEGKAEQIDDFVTKHVTEPGSTIKKGDTGTSIYGVDAKTNKPFTGDTEILSVKKAGRSIGGFVLPDDMVNEYGAQAWYLTFKTTVKERPSDYTLIPTPLYVSNDRTPMDEGQDILPAGNPECLYGPEMWGEVKGLTVTRCVTFITFNNEDPKDIILANYALDVEKYSEHAHNGAKYEYSLTK